MSAISVSSNALLQPTTSVDRQPTTAKSASWQEYISQRRPEVQQLQEALKAGDLGAAQQAYNNLVALGNQVLHRDNPFLRKDRALDFNAIGGALQNGDLNGARQAFEALHDTFRHKLPPVATASATPSAAEVTLSTAGNIDRQTALSLGNASDDRAVSGNSVNVVA